MGAESDIARDFVEVKLHHVGVGTREAPKPLRPRERDISAPNR